MDRKSWHYRFQATFFDSDPKSRFVYVCKIIASCGFYAGIGILLACLWIVLVFIKLLAPVFGYQYTMPWKNLLTKKLFKSIFDESNAVIPCKPLFCLGNTRFHLYHPVLALMILFLAAKIPWRPVLYWYGIWFCIIIGFFALVSIISSILGSKTWKNIFPPLEFRG